MPRCVHDGRAAPTGNGYPSAEGSRIALHAVAEHLRGETGLELVRFVLFSDATHGVFADALGELKAER